MDVRLLQWRPLRARRGRAAWIYGMNGRGPRMGRAPGSTGIPKAGSTMMNANGRRSGALAGVCALLVLSAGCDRRSESSKAVEQSAHDLHALSGGSPEPATSE